MDVIDLPGLEFHSESGHQRGHILLMSDLHIGARGVDYKLLRRDLEWAREHDAAIVIAGDVFDLIWPRDSKRFVPHILDERLVGLDNLLQATIDLAVKELEPYADLIAMIGVGNHETSMIKYHGFDAVHLLIERLGSHIVHGGYTGILKLPLDIMYEKKPKEEKTTKKKSKSKKRKPDNKEPEYQRTGGLVYRIWYHHGKGGNAPVTEGLIDFARASSYVHGADILWMGHKHRRYVHEEPVIRCNSSHNAKSIYPTAMWYVMSGCYSREGESQFDQQGYYRTSWAREKGMKPVGCGGVRISLGITREDMECGTRITRPIVGMTVES